MTTREERQMRMLTERCDVEGSVALLGGRVDCSAAFQQFRHDVHVPFFRCQVERIESILPINATKKKKNDESCAIDLGYGRTDGRTNKRGRAVSGSRQDRCGAAAHARTASAHHERLLKSGLGAGRLLTALQVLMSVLFFKCSRTLSKWPSRADRRKPALASD